MNHRKFFESINHRCFMVNNSLIVNKIDTVSEYIYKKCQQLNLFIRYEHLFNNKMRFVIYCKRTPKTKLETSFAKMFNGFVGSLQIEDGNVKFAIHAIHIPDAQFNAKIAENEFDNFDVYPLIDGTVVTLYYYDGEWRLSTKKAYECNRLLWRNKTTFGNAFEKCLAQQTDFSFDKLKKNCCYNLVFSCPEFHPFGNKYDVQLISTYNLNTIEKVNDADIGIKEQKKIDITFAQMMNDIDNAYITYKERGLINFGYSLRNKDVQNYDVILESDLMTQIRQLIYKINTYHDDATVNECFRSFDYVAMRAHLDKTKCSAFKCLFPQYDFTKIEATMQAVQKHVLDHFIKGRPLLEPFRKIFILYRLKFSHKKTKKEFVSLINDILYQPKYAHIYYRLMVNNIL